jgi:hypothetical protein
MVPVQDNALYNRANFTTQCTVQHCAVPRVFYSTRTSPF